MSTERPVHIGDEELRHRHEEVPPDYYHVGVERNFFQRVWHHRRLPVVEHFLSGRGGNLLDLGCHGGYLTAEIQRLSGAQVTGIDISADAIEHARHHVPGATFVVGDLQEPLPFVDRSFQTVTAFDVLEHIPRLERVLAEVWRVMEPGGRFVVGVPRDTWLFRTTWRLWTAARGAVWQDVHVHDFTAETLQALTQQHGFMLDETRVSHWGMYLAIAFRKPA